VEFELNLLRSESGHIPPRFALKKKKKKKKNLKSHSQIHIIPAKKKKQ